MKYSWWRNLRANLRLLLSKDPMDIARCIICGKDLKLPREHTDVCGERCFRILLQRQR